MKFCNYVVPSIFIFLSGSQAMGLNLHSAIRAASEVGQPISNLASNSARRGSLWATSLRNADFWVLHSRWRQARSEIRRGGSNAYDYFSHTLKETNALLAAASGVPRLRYQFLKLYEDMAQAITQSEEANMHGLTRMFLLDLAQLTDQRRLSNDEFAFLVNKLWRSSERLEALTREKLRVTTLFALEYGPSDIPPGITSDLYRDEGGLPLATFGAIFGRSEFIGMRGWLLPSGGSRMKEYEAASRFIDDVGPTLDWLAFTRILDEIQIIDAQVEIDGVARHAGAELLDRLMEIVDGDLITSNMSELATYLARWRLQDKHEIALPIDPASDAFQRRFPDAKAIEKELDHFYPVHWHV